MTILVTGGAGFIGSHMVWSLVDAGKDVVIIDNLSTGFSCFLPKEVPVYEMNIGDYDSVLHVIKGHNIESIIHFAGSAVVPDSVDDPLSYYCNNTSNTRTLLQAAVAGEVKNFVFSSTAAVYGGNHSAGVVESTDLRPESPYGWSKLMSEIMIQDAGRAYGLKYKILRYFNVSGADPKGRTGQSTKDATHLIKVACEAAAGKRPCLSVFGADYDTPDGTCVRDFIHVSDLVSAHMLALDDLRNGGKSTVLNCGYGKGYSVLDVVNSVRRVSGRSFEVKFQSRRIGDATRVVANAESLKRDLSWQPKFEDLDVIVAHALEWENKLVATNHNLY